MTTIVFVPADFRELFPAFASPTTYPDAMLNGWFDFATSYITDYNNGSYSTFMTVKQQTQALYLLTAHIGDLTQQILAGDSTGVLTSATIDKVTVANMPPPVKNGWQFWLATTPYGLQLWALLKRMAGAGFYVGGLPERRGFRKVYGTFGP